jgi:DNA topoisomerase VI subunit A
MKKKIGTILDEDIFFAAKHMALLQKKTLSEFLEDAIRTYLGMQKENLNISDETKGVMHISPDALKKVMEDETYFES